MTQIVELKGTEKRLYQLVAPLVMNPVVLKQNYNYPFRTSENFIWFVAVEGKEIVGFIPLEHKKSEAIINNYYKQLSSVTFIEHQKIFQELGFSVEKEWKRYVKMNKEK